MWKSTRTWTRLATSAADVQAIHVFEALANSPTFLLSCSPHGGSLRKKVAYTPLHAGRILRMDYPSHFSRAQSGMPNFRELRLGELLRIPLLRTPLHKSYYSVSWPLEALSGRNHKDT